MDPYSRAPRSPKSRGGQSRSQGLDGISQALASDECKSPTTDQVNTCKQIEDNQHLHIWETRGYLSKVWVVRIHVLGSNFQSYADFICGIPNTLYWDTWYFESIRLHGTLNGLGHLVLWKYQDTWYFICGIPNTLYWDTWYFESIRIHDILNVLGHLVLWKYSDTFYSKYIGTPGTLKVFGHLLL